MRRRDWLEAVLFALGPVVALALAVVMFVGAYRG